MHCRVLPFAALKQPELFVREELTNFEKGINMAALENKVVLVTGATSEIGKAAALALAQGQRSFFQVDAIKKERQPLLKFAMLVRNVYLCVQMYPMKKMSKL